MEVADRLRVIRKKLGFSQLEFASGLGLQQGSYSDIERGKVKNFSESFLLLLELNFGINSKWILNEEGEQLLPKRRDAVREDEAEYETVEGLRSKLKEQTSINERQAIRIKELESTLKEVEKSLKNGRI